MLKALSVLASVLWLLACASVSAQEQALAYTFENPQLQWGPCPPFLPAGCEIAVLHGDPSLPNVDIFFKVPAGSMIPSHTHTSAERMILVSGRMEVTYEGQSPVTLKVGSYAYGPAGKPHTATCAEGVPCVLFIAFEAPLDAIPTEGAAE
ncbi:MAG: cupin domain-containing protein [Woeseiaceae bacterium]|nr:cupin domain-containing protein [Woeseiaceae bacterium]